VADTNGTGLTAGGRQRLYRSMKARGVTSPSSKKEIGRNWAVEPKLGRVAHGVAHRVDRLKAIGNGQVPLAHATAWRLLTARAGVVCEF
jgi:DNA (cytosine-5)-methyltransferase 1